MLFPVYQPSPIGAPIEYTHNILHVSDQVPPQTHIIICDDMELPHTKGHTSNPWNKCPKRGLMTKDGQILIEKHYRSFQAWLKKVDCHFSLICMNVFQARSQEKISFFSISTFVWHLFSLLVCINNDHHVQEKTTLWVHPAKITVFCTPDRKGMTEWIRQKHKIFEILNHQAVFEPFVVFYND